MKKDLRGLILSSTISNLSRVMVTDTNANMVQDITMKIAEHSGKKFSAKAKEEVLSRYNI